MSWDPNTTTWEEHIRQRAEEAGRIRGDLVFQDGDIVASIDAPTVHCRITHVGPSGASFEVVKKDGTPDKRWGGWSGSLQLCVLVRREEKE